MDAIASIPFFGGFLSTVLPFVVVLGIVVFVHEYGHYIVARWCGIKSEVFSIGFGPVIWSRTDKRGTLWQVAALPLGGYVRMASRDDETMAFIEGGAERAPAAAAGHPGELSEAIGEAAGESRPKGYDPEAMVPFGPKPVPPDRWFESKSIPKRIAILSAGVIMNVILAVVVYLSVSKVDRTRGRAQSDS